MKKAYRMRKNRNERILKVLWVDDNTATARHQFLKDEAKKVRSRSDQVLHEIKDDFRTTKPAKWLPLVKANVTDTPDLTTSIKKAKAEGKTISMDEFIKWIHKWWASMTTNGKTTYQYFYNWNFIGNYASLKDLKDFGVLNKKTIEIYSKMPKWNMQMPAKTLVQLKKEFPDEMSFRWSIELWKQLDKYGIKRDIESLQPTRQWDYVIVNYNWYTGKWYKNLHSAIDDLWQQILNEWKIKIPISDKVRIQNERDRMGIWPITKIWPTTTPALWKPLQKLDDWLIAEARKYKSADDFEKRLKYFVTEKAESYSNKWLNAKKYAESLYKEWKISKDEILLAESVMKWDINTQNFRKIREEANRK